MAAIEIDVLQSRVTRMEETLRTIEQRLAVLERTPVPERATAPTAEPPAEPAAPPLFDFALMGRSVLIVGGAYLLRALTETGFVPQTIGVIAALAYALAWVAIADRSLARGRRSIAVYDSLTASLIAGSVIWEATTRFHVFTPPIASLLVVIAVTALFIVAMRRQSTALAVIAAALTTFTLTGLSISTADLLPTAIASAILGVLALRLRVTPYVKLFMAIVSDFLLLALIVMAGLERAPQSRGSVEVALLSIAALWVVAIESRPLWPGPIQTAVAWIIGAGGASLLAFDAPVLATLWSGVAVLTAAIGRRWHRPQWTLQSPLWIVAATMAAFVPGARMILAVVAVAAIAAFALVPIEATHSRFVLLTAVTLIVLVTGNWLLVTADPAVLAMERSIALSLAAVLLAIRRAVWPEAAIVARVVLAFAALKFLIEDFRNGRATTIFAALAAYGLAMVIIARRPIIKESS